MSLRLLACSLCTICFLSATAHAMPDMGKTAENRFAAMDSDKNGSVSAEEFKKVYPDMTDNAFTSIDSNKDGQISREEWTNFMRQHAMGAAGKGHMKPQTQPHAGEETPLITPPSQK